MSSMSLQAEATVSCVREDTEPYMTKDEILKSIEQGLKEAKLIREGKIKAIPAEEALNEL